MNETTAIERLRDGHLDALELLVRRYCLRGVRAAYLIVGDRSLAEDVVQTKFVELAVKIRQFDASREFSPWFLRSVVNAALNAAKRGSRIVSLEDVQELRLPAMDSWLARIEPGPEIALENKEMHEDVMRALELLTPMQRAAIICRYYLELDAQEMTESLDISRSSVKWRLHSARRRLRALLRRYAPSPADAGSRPPMRSDEE